MITLALAQMIYSSTCRPLPRRGRHPGVPRGKLFGFIDLSNIWAMYATGVAVFVGASSHHAVVNSPVRPGAEAIRENEPRAISLGYDTCATSISPTSSPHARRARGRHQGPGVQLASLTDVHWTMSGEWCYGRCSGGLGTCSGRWSARWRSSPWRTTSQLGAWVTVRKPIFVLCVHFRARRDPANRALDRRPLLAHSQSG